MADPMDDEDELRKQLIAAPQPWHPGLSLPGVVPPKAAPDAPPMGTVSKMANPVPAVGSPQMPAITAPRGTTQGDQAELSRKLSTGSGISQIHNKIENSSFGQNHPTLGKILGYGAQGIATLGDTALSAVAPSLAINLPGTQYHHMMGIHQDQRQVGQDVAEDEKQAQTGLTQAQTGHVNEETAEMPQKSADTHALTQAEIEKDTKAKKDSLLQMHADAVQNAIQEDRDPQQDPNVQRFADAITSIQPGENKEAGAPKVIQVEVGGKPHNMAWNPATKKYDSDQGPTGEKPTQAPGITMIVPNGQGGGTVERLTAGQTVAPGAQTAAGVNSLNTPTTQMRNVGAQASLVHEQTPMMLQEIDRLAPLLGPVAGRWNEFMQGKVGMDNPDMAGLRSDLLMYSSAVALMHARGRLPENLREEFDHAINAPKQTPENLKAVIQHIDQWTTQNMNAMHQGGGGQAGPKAGDVEDGYKFKGGDPKVQSNWEKVK
jgi:hypothetical protein